MDEEPIRTVCTNALICYGFKIQELIAIEEMAELTKALIKLRRADTLGNMENVQEEIADVYIMIKQLMIIYGEKQVEAIITRKVKRLKENMDHGCG